MGPWVHGPIASHSMSDRTLLESVARRAMQRVRPRARLPAGGPGRGELPRAPPRPTACETCATCPGRRSTTTSRAIWISSRSARVPAVRRSRVLVAIADVDCVRGAGRRGGQSRADEHDVRLHGSAHLPDASRDAVDRQDVAASRRRSRGDRHSARRRRRRPRPAVRRLSGDGAQSSEADVRRGGRVARRPGPDAGCAREGRAGSRRSSASRTGSRRRCARIGRPRVLSISIARRYGR